MKGRMASLRGIIALLSLTFGMAHVTTAKNIEIKSNLTATEKLALEKFRPLVNDVLYRDFMKEDYYLITFLRQKEMKLKDATDLLRTAHKWRRDNNIDNILNEDMSQLKKAFPCRNDGFDYEGRPITTWDVGKWDIRKMSMSGSMPLLIRYLDMILEDSITRVWQQRVKTGEDVTQSVFIIDGYGFGLRMHGCISCLPFYYAFITHTDLYYPQTARNVYLVNVPRVFGNILTVIRPVMSEHIKNSLKIYGYDTNEWKNELSKTIPPDQLRKQFGGAKQPAG